MRQVTTINWNYVGDAVPAFVTMAFMPLSYSIAYGLIAGLFTYATINGLIYITKVVTRGRFLPPDFDLAEYWTINPGGRPTWFMRSARNGGKFWDHEKPTPDEMNNDKFVGEEDRDGEHRRSDSQAELKGNAMRSDDGKGSVNIRMQDIDYHRH